MVTGETIAAIATAPGRGGVAIVRVSGPAAFAVARAVTGRAVGAAQAGRFFRVRMRDGAGHPLDDGVMLVFAAPHSYTGEDTVEFQGHGGTVAPRRVFEACLAAGARTARRGEFTLRAFLNGKLALDAAEAVVDLVDAPCDRAADEAFARLSGALSERYEQLYADALALSERLEYALDVDEGELPPDWTAGVRREVGALVARLRAAVATAREGKMLREGALVVLAGAPNAGKSSLLNALVGERRAIVSERAGTTRDAIEVRTEIGGWPVRLVDTAGIRETADDIESEGVGRARDLIASADLVVALDARLDGALTIHAKADLDTAPVTGVLAVSSVTGAGLDALRREIARRLAARAAHGDESGADVTARQRERLDRAAAALEAAGTDDPVLLANAVRAAAEVLGGLVGKTYSDDLLEGIFSRFCVGK